MAYPDSLAQKLQKIKNLYPDPRSAVMPALYLVQEEDHYITDQGINWVAEQLQIPPIQVREVATFYTMYYKKPVGKYHVQICRTVSCMLCGSKQLAESVRERLKVGPGEVTADGKWSYEEVECLGSCGTAPMCQINDIFFENLDPKKLSELLSRIENEEPDLKFSTKNESLGAGLKDCPKSQI